MNRIVVLAAALSVLTPGARADSFVQKRMNTLEIAVDTASGVVFVGKSGETADERVDVVDIRTGEAKGAVEIGAIPSDATRFRAEPVEENGFMRLVVSEIPDAAPESMIEVSPRSRDGERELEYSPGTAGGLTAGLLTGFGFAFRKFYENGWGFHVGFGGFKNLELVNANIGIELLRVLDESAKSRFYALAGTSVYYYRNQTWVPRDLAQDETQEAVVFKNSALYNVGMGIGMEWTPGANQKGIAFAIELPISLTLIHTEGEGLRVDGVRPIPSASIIYYFLR